MTAWGGPGQGTQQVPANLWKDYLNVADHPEDPSGSSAFCHAHAQAARLFLGDDDFNWVIPTPAGSSIVRPARRLNDASTSGWIPPVLDGGIHPSAIRT